MKFLLNRIVRIFRHPWMFLTEPFMVFSKAEDRRRAATAASFLFLSFIAVGIEQMAAGNTPFLTLVLLFIGYFIARTRWYKYATLILLATLSFPSYLVALTIPNPDPNRILAAFAWIILPLILSSLIYSLRTTIIFVIINTLALIILSFIRPELSFRVMGATLGFYTLSSLFMVIVMAQRNRIESDRQKELIESHNKLNEEVARRKRFAEQAQRRADQLVILNEFSRETSTLNDLPNLMENVYNQIRKVFPVDLFFIALYDKQKNELSFPLMYDNGQRLEQAPSPVTDGTFSGKTIMTQKPLLITGWADPVPEGGSIPLIAGNEKQLTRSLMFVPIQTGKDVVGVISAQSYQVETYSNDDLNILSGIANQVSTIIENARLYDAAQQEIEERLKVEEQLRATETRYRELVERIPAVIYSSETGKNGRWFYVSPQIEILLGFKPEEWIINPNLWYQQIHPEDREYAVTSEEQSIQKGSNIEMEYRMLARDERVLWIHDESMSVSMSDDNRTIVQGILTDVTARKQAELFLKESEERYHRLFVTAHRQAQELSLLGTVQSTLARELDLNTLFTKVVEEVSKTFGYTYVSLYMLEDDHLQLKHQVGYDVESVIEKISSYEGVSGKVIRTGQPLLIKDVTSEPGFLRASQHIQSEICVPLFDGDEICGTLNVESAKDYSLNENDLRVINILADQVNSAIRRARLYSEREESLKREQYINDFAHTISSTLDLPIILERAARVSVALTRAEGGTVSLMSVDGEEITDVYFSNENMEVPVIPTKGQGLTWLTYERGRPLIIDEYSDHPNALQKWSATGLHAYMGIPIVVGEKKLGVMAVTTNKGSARKFTPRDLSMLEAVARETAIAIQNAQLFEALQKELVGHKRTLKELENKNAELERFTYTVSHDLKSPIVTIGGFLGFLEEDINKERYERIPNTIFRIQEAAKKMERLLNELLELSRIGRLINSPSDVHFQELVQETLELVHGQLTERQVEVRVEAGLPIVRVDKVRMIEVLQNLIVNAVKFTGTQEHPVIEIGMEVKDDENIFFVKDNGMGVAPEFHERIFGLFNKLDPVSSGTGIGLALVKRIIEVHGGRIWVESEVGKGATFYFTLKNRQENS